MTTILPKADIEARVELVDDDVFAALRKTWQPVCLTRDLRAKRIISYTLLNEEIVIADLPSGLLAAKDLCPHRGAKFGIGAVVDGHLQCPYHGWEFAHTGACVKIPSLIDPTVSLAKSCLKTFAVQERYGMVWVRLDEQEIAPLPDVPEYESDWTFVVADPMRFGCGFRREIDNYLDMSHFAFAHRDTLGMAAKGQITDITITHYDDGFQMEAPFPVLTNPEKKPGKLQQSHHRRQRCFLPNFTTIRQSFEDGDERVLLHVPSPHTPTSCTVFWALAISPGFEGPPAEQQIAFAIRVLDEDRVMVENQRPLEVPIGAEEAVMVPADRLANTYKAALREFVLADRDGESAPDVAGANETITVLYGSQTGTAERLASTAARTLKRAGFTPTVHALQDVSPADVHDNVIILTSTYGNGEPPDNARAFYDALFAADSDFSDTRFAVFALGDKSYPNFCQCGRDLDARLEALGGRRLMSRVDCDVDIDGPFVDWVAGIQRAFRKGRRQDVVALLEDDLPEGYTASRPVSAFVIENRLLSLTGSAKETRHYEVDLTGRGLTYEPGDALGVMPTNSPELVESVLERLRESGERTTANGKTLTQALLSDVELRRPSFALLAEAAAVADDPELRHCVESGDRDALAQYAARHDVLELLSKLPHGAIDGSRVLELSDSLRPRLYSIASSPRVSPETVHLTVSTVRYRNGERVHYGAASTFLADRVRRHTPVPVYLHRNPNFRLPMDEATDIIMIGPGTGVAPFRAFLQDREASHATGRNWLFFGDQRRECDFLYEHELDRWHRDGLLTRLDTAFSRDGPDKVYVQHRLRERGGEVFAWLERGATLYVCGDSTRMAHDVDHALHAVIAEQAGLSAEDARLYVKQLQLNGRYRRDVY